MATRTINHTRRRKIKRQHVKIYLRLGKTSPPSFDADLALKGYDFSEDAAVFIEAYRQRAWMRFDMGRVGALQAPPDCTLTNFDSHEDILFRVKVVDRSGDFGRIVGEADQLRPSVPGDTDDERIPMLPVKGEPLGNELCRVEFDTSSSARVRLLVNSKLPDCKNIARTPLFISMVYPHILREILTRSLLGMGEPPDPDDNTDWRTKWLRFGARLPGMSPVEIGFEEEEKQDWIEDAVAAFARKHRLLSAFSKAWQKEEEKR